MNKPNNINRKSGKKSVLVWVSGYTLDCCYDCHVSLKTSVMNLIQVFGSGWAGGIGVGSHRRTVCRRRRETRKTQQQQGRRAPGHDGRPLTHLFSLWLFDDQMVNLHCELQFNLKYAVFSETDARTQHYNTDTIDRNYFLCLNCSWTDLDVKL